MGLCLIIFISQEWKKSNFDRHFKLYHDNLLIKENVITKYTTIEKPILDERVKRFDSYLKLIIFGGRPFEILNDEGLVELTKKENERLNLTASIENLKEHMNLRFTDMVEKVRCILSDKYITLKFDCASRHNRQFLCISAQFVHVQAIQNICLDFVELFERHTADNLSDIIINSLEQYSVSKSNIIGATTDTASNMLSTVRKMNEKMEIEENYFEPDDENELLSNIGRSSIGICHVKCISHVFNLIVNDFLSNYSKIVDKACSVAKFLRKPNVINLIRKMDLNLPPINNITR